ncbi:MAG: glycoside hydrolase family 43 protein [Bacteroidales bacterium]|nr:glycoside hydrolase family 43 protein [Bacteroidales bacterium]
MNSLQFFQKTLKRDHGKYNFLLLWSLLLLTGCNKTGNAVYLFSYFINNGEDGLHLAYSEDGFRWTALNENRSLLYPEAGDDKLMRDPCIIKGGNGKFHMVWTVSWKERRIGYAWSKDLIHWSEQLTIPVMQHEPEALNCWAPELFYDADNRFYMIYWSTTIPGRFPETEGGGDNDYNHRIYYTLTRDFREFEETRLLYDPGFNVIDATIQKIGNRYVMFLKNETRYPEPEKNIRIAVSSSLTKGYSEASEPITEKWVEGPTVTRIGEDYVVYFDRYRQRQMGAVRSPDLKNWTDISAELDFPEGTRHGTVLKINRRVLEKLLAL